MDLDDLTVIGKLEDNQTVSFLIASATALVVFDYFLTLNIELKHAWKKPWLRPGRVLFFITRYLVFVEMAMLVYSHVNYHLPPSLCHAFYKATSWLMCVGIVIAEAILTIRVWALWGCGRKMWIFINFVTIANGVLGAVFLARAMSDSPEFIPVDSLSATLPGCFLITRSRNLLGVYIAIMAHQSFIFSMTLIKGWRSHRQLRTPLIRTFYVDGVIYYLVLLILSCSNVVGVASRSKRALQFTSLQRAFTAILTSRMVFHLQTRPKIIELGNASTVCPASMGVPSVPIEFRDSSWDGLGEGEEDGDREDGQHRD